MEWFRLYHEIRHDKKLARLSLAEKWQFVVLLILASESENRGVIDLDEETICDELETDADGLKMLLHRLEKKGIVTRSDGGGIIICHWGDRQYTSDNSTERVKKFREKRQSATTDETLQKRYRNVAETPCNENETPPDTDTDTEEVSQHDSNTAITQPNRPITQPKGKSKPEKPDNYPFEAFWAAYAKKEDRLRCEKAWIKLSDAEKARAMLHVPQYVASKPDLKYRKNPLSYLNGKCWNDDIPQQAATEPANNGQPKILSSWDREYLAKLKQQGIAT